MSNALFCLSRCRACIDAGGDKDIIVSVDEGKWFEKKVRGVLNNVRGKDEKKVPLLPMSGWKPFPAISIPVGFCYGTIYDHIRATARVEPISDINNGDSPNTSSIDFNT